MVEGLFRIQLALQTSPLREIMLFLALLCIVLLFLWIFFSLQYRTHSHLRARHQRYFASAEKLIMPFKFLGSHSLHFFGRKTLVEASATQHGICLIPFPELSSEETSLKFCDYQERIMQSHLPIFSSMGYQTRGAEMVTVQKKLVQENGKLLQNLFDYRLDRNFTTFENEKLLLELAKNLNVLHAQVSETGKALYHGFILPYSFYIQEDGMRKITNYVLGWHGFCYAMGPKVILERMHVLRRRSHFIEESFRKIWLMQFNFLSPEQQNLSFLDRVGPKSDMYAFASLGLWLFSNRPTRFEKQIKKLPAAWRPFFKACLEPDPENRPPDFLEILEMSDDPELALSQYEIDDVTIPMAKKHSPEDIKKLLSSIIETKKSLSIDNYIDVASKQLFQEGFDALMLRDLDRSIKAFNRVLAKDSKATYALVGLAIAYFEQGDRASSRAYYEKAKALDEGSINWFHSHVATRL